MGADRSCLCLSRLAAYGRPSWLGSSSACRPWCFRCCRVLDDARFTGHSSHLWGVRSVVHGDCALKVSCLDAVGHAVARHHLVLGAHGIVHHHALVAQFVGHVCEVLCNTSVPSRVRALKGRAGGLTRVCWMYWVPFAGPVRVLVAW